MELTWKSGHTGNGQKLTPRDWVCSAAGSTLFLGRLGVEVVIAVILEKLAAASRICLLLFRCLFCSMAFRGSVVTIAATLKHKEDNGNEA